MSDLRTAVRDTLADVEWMIFGTWDTPRCLWCKGWQKADSLGKHPQGHAKRCKWVALMELTEQPEQLPLFAQEPQP